MKNFIAGLFIIMFMAGCTSDKVLKEKVSKILKENPALILEAMENKPLEFVGALNKIVKKAQILEAQKRKDLEKQKLAQAFEKPLVPNIRKDENIRGDRNAPIMLVEYSDFECPFCSRAYETVTQLRKKYGKKISFVYKHLPLSFHPQAMIAAKYYEAIRLQSPKKAYLFHDKIFQNQTKLRLGESFLKSISRSLSVNMRRLKKDLNSKKVTDRIKEDLAEAAKFNFQGTPGFLLNGIPIKGAYPVSHFENIIEQLKKNKKISL